MASSPVAGTSLSKEFRRKIRKEEAPVREKFFIAKLKRSISLFAALLVSITPYVVSAQPCVQPPSGLVAWWPGDGNATDIQGGNNGLLQNGATFAPGTVGQAFRLDGVDDYVTIPSSPDLNPTSTTTLEAWIKPEIVDDFQRGIAGTWDDISGDDRTYMLWIARKPEFLLAHSGNDYSRVTAPNPLQAGVWQHIAGTFDGTTIRLYIDGILVGETLFPGPIATNGHPFFIGRTDSGSNDPDFFKGDIDEIGLYNRALSADEIQAIFNAGKCKPLVGGSVLGMSPMKGKVTCRNLTTKKTATVKFSDGVRSWDCEQAGLLVAPGDEITQTITVKGPAD